MVLNDGTTLPNYTDYTCPLCSERIGFQKDNFNRALYGLHRTNLEPEVAALFDEFACGTLGSNHAYLDWVCPECGLSARVYMHGWNAGSNGEERISLLIVIESVF